MSEPLQKIGRTFSMKDREFESEMPHNPAVDEEFDRIFEGVVAVAGQSDLLGNVWTDEALDGLRRQLEDRYSDPASAHRCLILSGSAQVTFADGTPLPERADLEFTELQRVPASRVLRVMGDPDLDHKRELLAQVEAEAEALQATINRAQWGVLRLLERIRDQDLYRAAWSEQAGRFYQSFTEYLPDLLADWYAKGIIATDSVKQIYSYQRAERVFLNPANGFGVTAEEIVDLGITHFDRIAEALDYDRETGEVAAEPKAGKMTREAAQAALAAIRESRATGVPWTVQQARELCDGERGVVRKSIGARFYRHASGTVTLADLTVFIDGVGQSSRAGLDEEALAFLLKKLGIKTPLIDE